MVGALVPCYRRKDEAGYEAPELKQRYQWSVSVTAADVNRAER